MRRIFFFFPVCLMLASCQPALSPDDGLALAPPADDYNFSQIFEDFWRGMNRNYVFWSEEPGPNWDLILNELPAADRSYIMSHREILWDKVYDVYKPKFEALGVFPRSSYNTDAFIKAADTAKEYFYAIIWGLRDGHYTVMFEALNTNMASPLNSIQPTAIRLLQNVMSGSSHGLKGVYEMSDWTGGLFSGAMDPASIQTYLATGNYFVELTAKKYLDPTSSSFSRTNITGGDPREVQDINVGASINTGRGRIAKSGGGFIAYFHANYLFTTFAGTYSGSNSKVVPYRNCVNDFFNDLADDAIAGLIVDLRGCTGGDPRDLSYLWGRLITSPLTFAHTRSKAGEGRLDYGPWVPVQCIPVPASEKRLKKTGIPIVVLVNEGTASGAEFSTMILKAMGATVMGERTMGATSYPAYSTLLNGGSFKGSSFFTMVNTAAVQTRNLDGNIYEGVGIPPDVPLGMETQDWIEFATGVRDKQLEAAIGRIDSGHSFS
jgi:hypothetical protein